MKKKILAGLLLFVTLFTITGCESKKENIDNNNNNDVKESLTKDDIAKIEKDYLDSDNLFTFDSISGLSTSGVTVIGKVNKGSFDKYDVVEYIDNYGELKKGVISSTSSDKEVALGSSGGIMLQGIKEDVVKNSSIVFKRKEYNGIIVSVQSDISNFIKDKSNLKVNIDGKDYNMELIAFSLNDTINWTYVSLIMNEEIKISDGAEIKIVDANVSGKLYQSLK